MRKNFYLLLLLLITSCTTPPDDIMHSINITPNETIYFSDKLDGTLFIKDIKTKGYIGGQGIVYIYENGEQAISDKHFWDTPLNLVLQDGLVAYLEEAKSFDNIITKEDGLQDADYELYASIEKFEITYRKNDNISVDISIKFMLRNTNDKEVIFLDRYIKSSNILYDDMELFTNKLEKMLNEILSELTEDIKGRIS